MSKYKKIIDSFASGSQSEDTQNLFAKWLLSSRDADRKQQALDELWEETDSETDRLEEALISTRKRIFGKQENKVRKRPASVRRAFAAMVIIPLITIALSLLYIRDFINRSTDWQQVVIPCGERGQLTLSDGTELWLGAGTRVVYPASFSGKERKIFVDGELYAEIAHDPKHPFIIALSDTDVRVLGTTFALRAYEDDAEVELMLVEGGVCMDIHSDKYKGSVIMAPNDMLSFNRVSGLVEQKHFQRESFHSWALDGKTYFFNEPLSDIARQLSRRFNRQIVIADHELLSTRFDVFLTNDKSLYDVLNIFELNKSIGVEERDNIIYLVKK